MAKKSFNQKNPALDIIDIPVEEHSEQEVKATDYTPQPSQTIPDGYKLRNDLVELKSVRKHILLQPTVATSLKEFSSKNKISFNEVVNRAVSEYLQNNQ